MLVSIHIEIFVLNRPSLLFLFANNLEVVPHIFPLRALHLKGGKKDFTELKENSLEFDSMVIRR